MFEDLETAYLAAELHPFFGTADRYFKYSLGISDLLGALAQCHPLRDFIKDYRTLVQISQKVLSGNLTFSKITAKSRLLCKILLKQSLKER